jgi:predicted TIM-barrel fold metal-dependent hydrolase
MAAEEIERVASQDKRFVQVLVLCQGESPLGRKAYWPIYKMCEKYHLPLGIHAGSMMRHAPTQSGYPSYLVEDYVSNTQAFTAQVMSLLAEGVFVKFPELKVVLIESGVTFLPAMMWRMTKDWRGVRPEVPWIKRSPSNILRDNIRLTIQPFDSPPDPLDVERLLDHLGSEDMLLFSTDYPHYHYEGNNVIPSGIPESLLQKILVDNPLATYPRLKEGVQ